MTKKKIHYKVVIAGIAALTMLEAMALAKGINGTLFTLVIAVIAASIGVVIPKPIILKK